MNTVNDKKTRKVADIISNPTQETLAKYLNTILQTPLLTDEEMNELMRRIRRNGQDAGRAYKCLVMSSLRMVVSAARHYMSYGVELHELIAAGNRGLERAIERYVESNRDDFHRYALRQIRQFQVITIMLGGLPPARE